VAYLVAAIVITLSVLEGHLSIVGFLIRDVSYTAAKISTDKHIAQCIVPLQ